MISLRLVLLLSLFTIVTARSFAQPIVLEHADSLRGFKTESGEAAREVIGNVKLTQGNITITCRKATQFPQSNQADLSGNVKFVQDTLTIYTEHATYDGTTKTVRSDVPVKLVDPQATLTAKKGIYIAPEAKAIFNDNVTIVNDSVIIRADEITHFRTNRETYARHNVKLRSLATSSIAFSDSLAHIPKKKYSYLAPHPLLVKIDSTHTEDSTMKYDSLFIRSEWMEAFHDTMNERYLAHRNVEIVRGELAARAAEAEYFVQSGKLVMTKTPIVWYDSTELSGDTIIAQTRENKSGRQLERIEARAAAFGVTRSDSLHPERFDQLSGSVITVFVEHDTARRVVADNNALGIYFGYEDGSPRGTTRSSGDLITFHLKNKKAERIVITSGAEGKYFPEKMVRKREKEYRLLGFSWRDDRPTQPSLPTSH